MQPIEKIWHQIIASLQIGTCTCTVQRIKRKILLIESKGFRSGRGDSTGWRGRRRGRKRRRRKKRRNYSDEFKAKRNSSERRAKMITAVQQPMTNSRRNVLAELEEKEQQYQFKC